MTVTYSLGQMIDDTFRQLRGTMREEINILTNAIDAPVSGAVETITFTYPLNGITISALVTILDETMFVLQTNTDLQQATVVRGYDDTTPVVASAGAQVSVNPPWTRSVVRDRLKDEIRSWAPQVYAVKNVEIPIVSQQRGYDLGAITDGIIDVLRVTAPQPPFVGSPGYWDVTTTDFMNTTQADPYFEFIYNANANPVEFPSGKSLTLVGTMLPLVNGNLHVVYSAPFDVDTSWDESTDMLFNVGISEFALDIAPLGAMWRLLRSISPRRAMLNVQGQSRSDQDVTMPSILQAAAQYKADRDSRLGDERERLYTNWPIRSSLY